MKKYMKTIGLCAALVSSTFTYAQKDVQVYIKTKDAPDKKVENVKEINGKNVNTIALDFSVNPDLLKNVDGFTIYVKRNGVSAEGTMTLSVEEFNRVSHECSRISGNRAIYPRIMDYAMDATNGNGHFLLQIHKETMGAAFILSRKGMDYSVNTEVDEYDLTISAYTYKIIGYNQEWVESEHAYRNVPVYDENVITICEPIHVKVKTTADIAPMGKSNAVRDVNDLKAIFGGN